MKNSTYTAPSVRRYGSLSAITAVTQDSTNEDTFEGVTQPDETGLGSSDSIEVVL